MMRAPGSYSGLTVKQAERRGFPWLSHRTVDQVSSDPAATLCLTPDRISSVPILHGFGTDDCWQFLFVIPGETA